MAVKNEELEKMVIEKMYESLEGLYMGVGKWTLPAMSCTGLAATVEDQHGRKVQVHIKVTADEDEWM